MVETKNRPERVHIGIEYRPETKLQMNADVVQCLLNVAKATTLIPGRKETYDGIQNAIRSAA